MYSILRAKKLKSIGAIARSARHTFREQATPNADPSITKRNQVVGANSYRAVLASLGKMLPAKRRRDAVLCIEYLITASPNAFSRHGGKLSDLGDGYFSDAMKWLRERHGPENVICGVVHLDESTPHLVAYVVPITKDGRLSARDFLGGPKVLAAMQDSFHNACGASRGLLRGVSGSKAKHEDIGTFYRALAAAGEAPRLKPIDYAAKACGYETEAWKEAEALVKNNLLATGMGVRKRGRDSKRHEALIDIENDIDKAMDALRVAEDRLKRQAVALAERELAVSRAESDMASKASVDSIEVAGRVKPRSVVKKAARPFREDGCDHSP